jgi:hypothetical protein
VPPTLVRLAHRTLERGRWSPRKRYGHPSRTRTGRRCDVGPVRRVSSVTIGPVRPFPPPRCHPGRCSAILDIVGVRDDKIPPRLLLCTLRLPVSCTLETAYGRRPNGKLPHRHPRIRSWTDTGRATTPCQQQDSPGWPSTLQHCAPYRYIVRHDFKPPLLHL